jgi:UDP-N-acetylmuramate dehydrogenase
MMRCGAVSVSGVHANFFINEGGGTSADFLALVNDVRNRVRDRSDVELQMEVKMWGF